MSYMTHKGVLNYKDSLPRTLAGNQLSHGRFASIGKLSAGDLHLFPLSETARFRVDPPIPSMGPRREIIDRFIEHA